MTEHISSQPPNIAEIQSAGIVPSLQTNLMNWESCITRLEHDIDSYRGTNQSPEWYLDWMNGLNDETTTSQNMVFQSTFKRQLEATEDQQDQIRAADIFVELYLRDKKLNTEIYGENRHQVPTIDALISILGEDMVAALAAGDDPNNIRELCLTEAATENVCVTPQLKVLTAAYNVDSPTELYGVTIATAQEERLQQLLRSGNVQKWIRFLDEDRTEGYKENQHAALEWMSKAVALAAGIGQDVARNYCFSGSRKYNEQDNLQKILEKFDYFGVSRLNNLSDMFGIYGLESYTIAQLEAMERIIRDPESESHRLAEHDVQVLMSNRFGDHNGVMSGNADMIDDGDQRTIFFELTTMGDIYRNFLKLKRIGIHPSTLVLAAHSLEGKFVVSDDRDPQLSKLTIATVTGRALVAQAHAQAGGKLSIEGAEAQAYALHGMTGAARIMNDMMRPSKGREDPDVGRKKIIFQACHLGTEVPVHDLDENGDKAEVDKQSVVSQLAADLATHDVDGVDIFGAVGGMQMKAGEKGVGFTGAPTVSDGVFERVAMPSVKASVDYGKVELSQVDKIALRK
ncbi:MAG: hypothetical protein M3Q79_02905 [bacterium]|nr:hypothetical protein [bacterium]